MHHQLLVNWVDAALQRVANHTPQPAAVETIEMHELWSSLGFDKIAEASEAISQFLDTVLAGQARGQWNPTS